MRSPQPGSFEYLEAQIRRNATSTQLGRDFEWVCRWYLEHAPLYRGKFRKVWFWSAWPDRWGRDCGIDLIAETHDGQLWAVQTKAVANGYSITKAEVDSFLSESNRRPIAHRLLIATTDVLGSNARRTIDQQAKRASFVGRGDLLAADILWPTKAGGTAPRPQRAKPRPHQRAAIAAVLRGFRRYERGRLIMACGTGKTLTGLWIHERLKSRRTLLLVPSLSLIQQNLREWGRHARDDFDCLVVCSDESVASDRDDPALRYIAELGIDVTTNAADIAAFLCRRRHRPVVVIATYHSSDRVSNGQRRSKTTFDLALCDEAHRLVGDVRGKFATVLDDQRISCRRRLFMTATPRYFTQRLKARRADEGLDVVSMDDVNVFGPEFHVLTLRSAMEAKPEPLLTDYRVVVLCGTKTEAAKLVRDARLVRTQHGTETNARTLAAQIGLAKAIKKYNLKRIITFHQTVRRAERFADEDRPDSFPSIVRHLSRTSTPSGQLWARALSSKTPGSKRASLVRELAEIPKGRRGMLANCACLSEGVDVPALDGIAFIDPKKSVVEIIQAVGRVIRKASHKSIGTIVIPVLVEESADEDKTLDQSAFRAVWQTLRALRAHDSRLADWLDHVRASLSQRNANGRIPHPPNFVLNVTGLRLRNFEQAFYVRAVKTTTEKPPLTIEKILVWADTYHECEGKYPTLASGNVAGTDETWPAINAALREGLRGLPGGTSLAEVLEEHRGRPNKSALPSLTERWIVKMAKQFKQKHGRYPTIASGQIEGTQETWRGVDSALNKAHRNLPRKTTLAKLLEEKAGKPPRGKPLTISVVLAWADDYREKNGKWPTKASGRITGTNETWLAVDTALHKGLRSLPKAGTLAQVLAAHRGAENRLALEALTVTRIKQLIRSFYKIHGEWPTPTSGRVHDTLSLTWAQINRALSQGLRSFKGGSSLAKIVAEVRGVSYRHEKLTESAIVVLAKKHKKQYGEWPTQNSGAIDGTTYTWKQIDGALRQGLRGLKKSSLAQLLAKRALKERWAK